MKAENYEKAERGKHGKKPVTHPETVIKQPGARRVVASYRAESIVTDPQGSYTGNTEATLTGEAYEKPIQDADDL